MPRHRTDPAAGALARGPAKTDDIESAREDLDRAERVTARKLREEVMRFQRSVGRREVLLTRRAADRA